MLSFGGVELYITYISCSQQGPEHYSSNMEAVKTTDLDLTSGKSFNLLESQCPPPTNDPKKIHVKMELGTVPGTQ